MYKLVVNVNDSIFTFIGKDRDYFLSKVIEWEEFQGDVTGNASKFLKVHGFFDRADRGEAVGSFRMDVILGIHVEDY